MWFKRAFLFYGATPARGLFFAGITLRARKTIPIRGFSFAPDSQRLNEQGNDLDMETLDLLQEMLSDTSCFSSLKATYPPPFYLDTDHRRITILTNKTRE